MLPASGPCSPSPGLAAAAGGGRGASIATPSEDPEQGAGPCDPHTSRDLGAAPGRSGTRERSTRIQRCRSSGDGRGPGVGMGCGLLSLSLWKHGVLRIVRPTGFPSPTHQACRSSRVEPWFSKCGFWTTTSLGATLECKFSRLHGWGSATGVYGRVILMLM